MRATPAPESAPRPVRVPGFDLIPGSHAPHSRLPRHSHELPSICLIHAGQFTEHYAGKAVDCASGMVKVTPAGEPHWNRFGHVRTIGLRIDVDRSRFAELPAIHRWLGESVVAHSGAATEIARRVMARLPPTDDASIVALEGLLLELVGELARQTDGRSSGEVRWLRQAHEIVQELYPTRLSLSDIAAAVGVHPATLSRTYRRTFRCTVGEHIRRLRLEAAAAALERTDRPFSDIAMDCGFYDQSHFAHAFRRRYGCTPGDYRRRFRE